VVHLIIAIKLGGITQFKVTGFGESKKVLENIDLRAEDVDEIEQIFRDGELMYFEWFFPHLEQQTKRDLYTAIEHDLENGEMPVIERYDDLLSLIDANAGYIGLFFFMSVIIFFLYVLGETGVMGLISSPWIFLLMLVLLEEVGKGIGYFVTPTLKNHLRIGETELNANVAKGIVAGCGFGFAETFMRLERGVHPVVNLLVRLPTALVVHMVCSAIFFVALDAFISAREENATRRDLAWPVGVMALAVIVHLTYNVVVRWLFG